MIMSLRRKLTRFKNKLFRNRHWLRKTCSLEKIAGAFVAVCVIFILTCNYLLQNPVQLKSPEVSPINIISGALRVPQTDPRIINYIRNLFLRPRPPTKTLKFEGATSSEYVAASKTITDYVLKLLKNKVNLSSIPLLDTNGYFVEYPAKDGILNSQTILLEKVHNWTGLLIEHDPKFIHLLKEKKRYSWISTACLSTQKYPELEKHERPLSTGDHNLENSVRFGKAQARDSFFAQCFPLYSILLSLNVTSVDFLSLRLDNVAAQLNILKTLPLKAFMIKVISIDVEATDKEYTDIFQFVTSKGYIMPRHFKGTSETDKSRQIYIHHSLV